MNATTPTADAAAVPLDGEKDEPLLNIASILEDGGFPLVAADVRLAASTIKALTSRAEAAEKAAAQLRHAVTEAKASQHHARKQYSACKITQNRLASGIEHWKTRAEAAEAKLTEVREIEARSSADLCACKDALSEAEAKLAEAREILRPFAVTPHPGAKVEYRRWIAVEHWRRASTFIGEG